MSLTVEAENKTAADVKTRSWPHGGTTILYRAEPLTDQVWHQSWPFSQLFASTIVGSPIILQVASQSGATSLIQRPSSLTRATESSSVVKRATEIISTKSAAC